MKMLLDPIEKYFHVSTFAVKFRYGKCFILCVIRDETIYMVCEKIFISNHSEIFRILFRGFSSNQTYFLVRNKNAAEAARIRNGGKFFDKYSGKWRDIKYADMGHKVDAVKWWNSTDRKYGAKSKEVRRWMLDSKNYELESTSINRSNGANLPDRYLPPLK